MWLSNNLHVDKARTNTTFKYYINFQFIVFNIPMLNVTAPAGTTHVEFVSALGTVDFEAGEVRNRIQ